MSGKLTVDEVRHNGNGISVTWAIDEYLMGTYDKPIESPPFGIQNNGHAVPFSLITQVFPEHYVRIKRNYNIGTARAIITLFVKHLNKQPFVGVKLSEYWADIVTFPDPGLPPNRISDSANWSSSYRRTPSIIKCHITWLGFKDSSASEILHHPMCITKLPFNNKLTPNVTLAIGDKEIPAHKTVLTLHSIVFMGMFEAPMKESLENRVVIEDIEFDTMKILIDMIYTGEYKVLEDIDTALKVLAAAEKYQMTIVKSACETKLQSKINHEHALRLLEEAEMYGAEELFRTCLEYVVVAKLAPFSKVKEICLQQPKFSAMLMDLLMGKLETILSQ